MPELEDLHKKVEEARVVKEDRKAKPKSVTATITQPGLPLVWDFDWYGNQLYAQMENIAFSPSKDNKVFTAQLSFISSATGMHLHMVANNVKKKWPFIDQAAARIEGRNLILKISVRMFLSETPKFPARRRSEMAREILIALTEAGAVDLKYERSASEITAVWRSVTS